MPKVHTLVASISLRFSRIGHYHQLQLSPNYCSSCYAMLCYATQGRGYAGRACDLWPCQSAKFSSVSKRRPGAQVLPRGAHMQSNLDNRRRRNTAKHGNRQTPLESKRCDKADQTVPDNRPMHDSRPEYSCTVVGPSCSFQCSCMQECAAGSVKPPPGEHPIARIETCCSAAQIQVTYLRQDCQDETLPALPPAAIAHCATVASWSCR